MFIDEQYNFTFNWHYFLLMLANAEFNNDDFLYMINL